MKKLLCLILLGAWVVCSVVPVHAKTQLGKTQSQSLSKEDKRQQKAQKKYAKAQRKAERKMLKTERKNTKYPKHSLGR